MNKKYFWTFIALMVIYVILAFTLPTNPEILQKYNISQNHARVLNLSIVIPLSIVYFSALYGFLRFKSYANTIEKTKEGKPLQYISTGLMVLAFSLPINSILGSLLNYILFQHPDLSATSAIIRNYVSLIFSFVAFLYISRGAESLLSTLKDKKVNYHPAISLLGPILLSSFFSWLVTLQSQDQAAKEVYYMPNWIVILTLAVPYVYVWCVAINAARNLYIYKDRVRGVLYKRAIDHLAKGIGVIILLSIFLQLITTISTFNRLNLTPLLLIVYVLVAMYALGYGWVARGAKKLKQIEEV